MGKGISINVLSNLLFKPHSYYKLCLYTSYFKNSRISSNRDLTKSLMLYKHTFYIFYGTLYTFGFFNKDKVFRLRDKLFISGVHLLFLSLNFSFNSLCVRTLYKNGGGLAVSLHCICL